MCHSTRHAAHLCSSVLEAHSSLSGVKIPDLSPASRAHPHRCKAAKYQGLLLSVCSPWLALATHLQLHSLPIPSTLGLCKACGDSQEKRRELPVSSRGV